MTDAGRIQEALAHLTAAMCLLGLSEGKAAVQAAHAAVREGTP